MLYFIASPIGNLKDITYRAVEVLGSCDYILCEDTRQSHKLLSAYDIKTHMKSYHKFNEASRLDSVIHDLKNGMEIGLISDAGTPIISDPGSLLMQALVKHNLPFTHLPGPNAAIFAYLASGFHSNGFSFLGFLPKKSTALNKELVKQSLSHQASIYYLSPRQILSTLNELHSICPNRSLFLGKEFTKKFEYFFRGNAKELLNLIETDKIRGEWVLVMSPFQKDELSSVDPLEYVDYLEKAYSLSRRDAIKLSAEILGIPKRLIYAKDLE